MGRFDDALARPGLGAIAEIKRRSPSAGDLRPDADPAVIAPAYAGAGAAAISVLVDERFGGTWDDLRAARAATTAPLLAKGFFSTDEHLRTAKEAGADAVLLLLRDLDDGETARLMGVAESLGLDTLVEAHDADELDRGHRARRPRARRQRARPRDVHDRPQGPARARGPDPRRPDRDRRERHRDARPGRRGRAGGRRRRARRLDADARRRPGSEARGAALAPARQGVRADARGGRRRGRRGGRRPRRLHSRAREPARGRRPSCRCRTGCSRSPSGSARPASPGPTSTRCTRSRRARCAAARRRCSARAPRWRGCSTCPGRAPTPTTGARAAEARAGSCSPAGSGPDNVRAAIAAVQPWAVDAASSLESAPGIKDHDKVRRYVEAARS